MSEIEKKFTCPRYQQWPHFDEEMIEASRQVLLSGKVNRWTGTENILFEEEFASFCNTKHAIALANGTVALELILYGLGIAEGDEVIVPCRTFIASASCAVVRGATPVIVDIDRESQNLTVDTIRPALTKKTKAIICVHLNGWPCDMDPILALAKEHNLAVIEDCAQAHGAVYKSRMVGSMGHAAAFSFCQDKIMTTGGEGGMVVTNDTALWKKMWSHKDHGKEYDTVFNKEHPPGFRWLHESFGTNWRMTEMQAAIGRIQLKRLPEWLKSRRQLAQTLNTSLQKWPCLRLTKPSQDIQHAYYKYYVFIEQLKLKEGWSRDRVIEEINKKGVPCMQGICGMIQDEKAFETGGRTADINFWNAKELIETSIMFMVHPTLTESDIKQSSQVITDVLSSAMQS